MTDVVHLHSGLPGAPSISNTLGSLVTLLDAVLVNGFCVTAVTDVSVTSGVATLKFAIDAPYPPLSVIQLYNGAAAELTGRFRVISKVGNDITVAAPGLPDGVVSPAGLTAKFASAGWEIAFAGDSTTRAYKQVDPRSSRSFFRVKEMSAPIAGVHGYSSMSDINTGQNQFPTNIQAAASGAGVGARWLKNASGVGFWDFAGDYATALFCPTETGHLGIGGARSIYGIGDYLSSKPGDAYAQFVTGSSTDSMAGDVPSWGMGYRATGNTFGPRSYTQIGGGVILGRCPALPYGFNPTGASGGANPGAAYPNGPDQALLLSQLYVTEGTGVRGVYRGVYHSPQNMLGIAPRSIFSADESTIGHRMLAVLTPSTGGSSGVVGASFIDIDGPWG